MPHVTTILGNEAGVQYQGVKDASVMPGVPVISGLIVGRFKRGRFDRPMTITVENIKAMLGEDPGNPYYTAVQDALATGVPSVQVLRVPDAQTDPVDPVDPVDPGDEVQPMIVGGLFSAEVSIVSGTQLTINWGSQVQQVFDEQTEIDDTSHNRIYFYRAIYPDTRDNSDVRIEIMPKDGESKINTITLNYLTTIFQWYSNGYVKFMDVAPRTNGLGNYLTAVPAIAPPNTTNYDGMFHSCFNINDPKIASWDVREAESMNYMFLSAGTFNQDLSKWCVPKVTEAKANLFSFSATGITPAKTPVWGTCPLG